MARTGFHFLHGRLQAKFSIGPHPKTDFFVRKCGREEWTKFSRYHYLNNDLASACKCYGLYDEQNKIVGFCAVMPFPHPKVKNMRRCSRLVILPDYQGIGLGVKFLTAVAELYKKDGFDFRIVTTLKNFSKSLVNSGKFLLKNCDVCRPMGNTSTMGKSWAQNLRKVKTCSFKFVGGVND